MNNSHFKDLYDVIKVIQKIMRTTPQKTWWNKIFYKFREYIVYDICEDYFHIQINGNTISFISDPDKTKAIFLSTKGQDVYVYKSNIRSEDMPHIEKLMHIKDDTDMEVIKMEHEIWKSTQKH